MISKNALKNPERFYFIGKLNSSFISISKAFAIS